jgi:uracil-DNA glycosylase
MPREQDVELELEKHRRALVACRRCDVDHGVSPIVSLARRPRAMLVGQAPGKVEAGGGRAFAGRAGKTLFRWFALAGLNEATARDKIYIAAVTRCYPGPSPSGRGDRVPTPVERANCGGWLDAELRLLQPRLLILVGRLAIERFLPRVPLEELIGREHQVEHLGGRSIAIPLPHPSGASSWVHQGNHPELLSRALKLLGTRLAELRIIDPPERSVA